VNEPSKDDERLAALLDGRVDAAQREALLAHLSAGGEDYDVYTEAAAILQTMEERKRAAATPAWRVFPFRRTGTWRWRSPAGLAALAAVLAAVAFAAVLIRRPSPRGESPLQLAVRADPARRGLPAGALGSLPWVALRGSAATGNDAQDGARAGILLTDLAVAVRAGDPATIRLRAEQLQRYLALRYLLYLSQFQELFHPISPDPLAVCAISK